MNMKLEVLGMSKSSKGELRLATDLIKKGERLQTYLKYAILGEEVMCGFELQGWRWVTMTIHFDASKAEDRGEINRLLCKYCKHILFADGFHPYSIEIIEKTEKFNKLEMSVFTYDEFLENSVSALKKRLETTETTGKEIREFPYTHKKWEACKECTNSKTGFRRRLKGYKTLMNGTFFFDYYWGGDGSKY